MVTRFLQEQPLSWIDCGSQLIGFLDFYGNCFDPRKTGISVARRHYFPRVNTEQNETTQNELSQMTTNDNISEHRNPTSTTEGFSRKLRRRHSFHDSQSKTKQQQSKQLYGGSSVTSSRRPFSFDPLFVEDPLRPENNVGRNSFRINQIQRVFSDAHRALTATLEWDMNSADEGGGFPLLNGLLQSREESR
jgi:DNA polymerase sigma